MRNMAALNAALSELQDAGNNGMLSAASRLKEADLEPNNLAALFSHERCAIIYVFSLTRDMHY